MKSVQCYELFGGIALKNHAFSFHMHVCGTQSDVLFTRVASYAVFKHTAIIIKQKRYYAMLALHRAHLLSWGTFNKKCTYIFVPECVYPHIHFCFKIIEERIIFHCIREVIDQNCFRHIICVQNVFLHNNTLINIFRGFQHYLLALIY